MSPRHRPGDHRQWKRGLANPAPPTIALLRRLPDGTLVRVEVDR